MGRDKALLLVDGVPMARRVADALTGAGAAVVVAAGGDREGLAELGLEVWPDDEQGAGPLGAVIGALGRAPQERVLVVGCDLLAPDPEAMAAVVRALDEGDEAADEGVDVAVPVVDGVRQWHHAAWRRRAAAVLRAARQEGVGSLHRAAGGLLVAELVDGDGHLAAAVADADRPGDLPAPG